MLLLDASSLHCFFVLVWFFCWVSCLTSKHIVRSLDLNQLWVLLVLIKLDWLKEGCSSGERRIQSWSMVMNSKAMGSSSRIFPTWLKRDRLIFPASLLRGTGLMHTAGQAGVRGLSLLAGFSLLISEISWGFWGGLMLFFWPAQWADQDTRNQNQSNPSWH